MLVSNIVHPEKQRRYQGYNHHTHNPFHIYMIMNMRSRAGCGFRNI